MSKPPSARSPLVLVVDDDKTALEIASEAFGDEGCAVISATEPEEAIRQMRASPAVDLLYTDVKLQQKPQDISGIFLGDFVKAERPDVPVAIYSINFREDELSDRLHAVAESDFDLVLPRGGTDEVEFRDQISQCVTLATAYRNARFGRAGENRARTDEAKDFTVVREFTIGSDAPSGAEKVLRDNGYSLRILSLRIGDEAHRTVATWLLEFEGRFEAEVYANPHLHATGESADEALSRLVVSIGESPEAPFSGMESDAAISRLLLSLGREVEQGDG